MTDRQAKYLAIEAAARKLLKSGGRLELHECVRYDPFRELAATFDELYRLRVDQVLLKALLDGIEAKHSHRMFLLKLSVVSAALFWISVLCLVLLK